MPASNKSSSAKSASKSKGKSARTTKSKSTPVQEVAPQPVQEVVQQPVQEVAPQPVQEVVQQPVQEVVQQQVQEDVSIEQQFKDILVRIQEFRTLSSSLTADVRKLQKNVTKHVRDSNKKNRKRVARNDGTKRPPSGFAKPALISDPLCQFLGKPSGSEMARTEVTKYLTQYIKQHSLQDQENKRRINCDSALKSLLNVQDSDEVTYFNLQRYMKPHFPTSAANLAAAALVKQ
jgi:chromatin remodeling complex protein RSC6